ncbi:MAG: dienelactone hydrolase family protein [Pseudomonadota bacterium]
MHAMIVHETRREASEPPRRPGRLVAMHATGLVMLALAACSGGVSEDAPLRESLADGPSGAEFALASRAPYDFPDLAAGRGPEDRIVGRLLMPDGDGPVRGAAILSHGAGGLGSRQHRMAERLAARGIASLVLDHFGPRGIGSTVRDQLRATEQTMVGDVYRARRMLASHPRIPTDKIGMIGWSKGGTTAVLASVARIGGFAAPEGEGLAFAIAFYPFCGFALGEEPLGAPLLMLLAGRDDWTPAEPCQRLTARWQDRGQPATEVTYDSAPHGFDSGLFFEARVDRAIAVRRDGPDCMLTLAPDGQTVTVDGTHKLNDITGRERFLAACGERGVTFGGDRAARGAAFAEVDRFLADILGP